MTTVTTQQPARVGFTIIVSRPCAALLSNGGHGNRYVVNEARSKAKMEAYYAALFARRYAIPDGAVVFVEYTELLGPRQCAMDDDLIGAMKAYRDGIALALGINDNRMRVQPCGPAVRGDVSGVAVRVWIDEVKS